MDTTVLKRHLPLQWELKSWSLEAGKELDCHQNRHGIQVKMPRHRQQSYTGRQQFAEKIGKKKSILDINYFKQRLISPMKMSLKSKLQVFQLGEMPFSKIYWNFFVSFAPDGKMCVCTMPFRKWNRKKNLKKEN